MFTIIKSTFIAILLAFVAAIAVNCEELSHNDLVRSADLNLMQFMMRSTAFSQENPQRSLTCFDYYVPVLNGITAEYERSYAACLAAADGSLAEIDASTKSERDAIESSAQGACEAFSSCNDNANSILYFECYANAGSENTKVMYSISSNSSTILAEIREQYRLVENEQNRCTNASERAYVQNTATTYEQLQSCLTGKSPIPTTTTTTTSPPITTTTTAEPTTTTTTTTSPPITTTTTQPEPESPDDTTIPENINLFKRNANYRLKRLIPSN